MAEEKEQNGAAEAGAYVKPLRCIGNSDVNGFQRKRLTEGEHIKTYITEIFYWTTTDWRRGCTCTADRREKQISTSVGLNGLTWG